jgi:hypothetical protein
VMRDDHHAVCPRIREGARAIRNPIVSSRWPGWVGRRVQGRGGFAAHRARLRMVRPLRPGVSVHTPIDNREDILGHLVDLVCQGPSRHLLSG